MSGVSGNAMHQIAVMGALGVGRMRTEQLADQLPIDRKQVAAATGRLIARGLVQRLEIGEFELTEAGRAALASGAKLSSGVARGWRKAPVYADSLRQRAWRAMRLVQRFSVADIEPLAVKGGEREAGENIRRFCHALASAGYLVDLPQRVPGTAKSSNGFKVWRLARDTGEVAPRYMAGQRAFQDRNTREVFPCV